MERGVLENEGDLGKSFFPLVLRDSFSQAILSSSNLAAFITNV